VPTRSNTFIFIRGIKLLCTSTFIQVLLYHIYFIQANTSDHAPRLLTLIHQTMSPFLARLTRRGSSDSMASDSTELSEWSYEGVTRRTVRSVSAPTLGRVEYEKDVRKLRERKADKLWKEFWC
jgi:hypothetical protein